MPAAYIVRQMAAFKNGERKGVRATVMIAMAKVLSDAEVKAAADYFAALKPTPGYQQGDRGRQGAGELCRARAACASRSADGGYEPIGSRIIVLPQNAERAALRDPNSGFIDYVPKGSIARGAALMAGGDGKTIACTICHGADAEGPGRGAGHRRPAGDLHVPPAQRHEDRQPQRAMGRTDEAGGRQALRRRHDRARRPICGSLDP